MTPLSEVEAALWADLDPFAVARTGTCPRCLSGPLTASGDEGTDVVQYDCRDCGWCEVV